MLTSDQRANFTGSRRIDQRPARPSHRSATAKGGTFWVLVILVEILCLIGVVMVLSASSIVSLHQFGSPWHFFERQLMWLAVGSAGFFVAVRVDHLRWRRLAPIMMYATIGLLFAVLGP
jgi:cell division protein FtsW (lipid II flippase)